MPSVPNCTVMQLPLRVLGSLARLLETVLLGLFLARVTGEETGLLQGRSNGLVDLEEGTRNAESERSGLTGHSAAFNGGVDVVGLLGVDEAKRLHHHLAVRRRGEVVVEGPTVDRDGAGAGAKAHASDGLFAPTGRLGEGYWHVVLLN